MSLFSSLYGFIPSSNSCLEDFHTEIVVHVLNALPEQALRWLNSLGATDITEPDEFVVHTQEELNALATHSFGSRPDIAVRLAKGGRREIVYIESKVGSSEGANQLSRYLDHLEIRPEDRKTLVFITRSYEPKEPISKTDVSFIQTRWSHFFRAFHPHRSQNSVLSELLKFMKANNMAQSNKVTPIDIVALTNFPRSRKLMDSTMWESIHRRFNKFSGKIFYKESAFTQLRNFDRYVMAAGFGSGHQFELLLGYWLDQDSATDSPWVGVTWHVNPKAAKRSEIVRAFEAYARNSQDGWETFWLTDEKTWGGLARGKELTSFLTADDHVHEITLWFDALLDQVAEFKKQFPELPWRPQGDSADTAKKGADSGV